MSPAAAYFHEHLYDITDECMIWPFGLSGEGYGRVQFDNRRWLVHSLACQMWHGPRPKGMDAAHGPCHNRACWNGAHLSWKTRQQNLADKVRDGTAQRGEAATNVRLTEREVRIIRSLYADKVLDQNALARAFQVSQASISLIVNRKHWASVA